MDEEFISIDDISEYLGLKKSTLYLKVERQEIPHYKFGRLIKFKKDEIDRWANGFKRDPVDLNRKVNNILKAVSNREIGIDRIIKKSIDEVKSLKYTSDHGKPGQIKGLRKEGLDDGIV